MERFEGIDNIDLKKTSKEDLEKINNNLARLEKQLKKELLKIAELEKIKKESFRDPGTIGKTPKI